MTLLLTFTATHVLAQWTSGVFVEGKDNAYNVNETGILPYVDYNAGDRPPIMATQRIDNGAVVAAGVARTTRNGRWNDTLPVNPAPYLDVLFDKAFQWMVPGAENVLWYENSVYNNTAQCSQLIDNLGTWGYTIWGDDRPLDTSGLLDNVDILVIPQLQMGDDYIGGDPAMLPNSWVSAIDSFVTGGGGLLIMEGSDCLGWNFCRVQNKILDALGFNWWFQHDEVGDTVDNWYEWWSPIAYVDPTTAIGSAYKGTTGTENIGLYAVCSLVELPLTFSVNVSVAPAFQSGLPGENLEYTVTVRNLSNVDDNYDLIVQDTENWSLSIDQSIMVPSLENRTTLLTVTIPEDATGCTSDNVTVNATSKADNTLSDNGSCIAHVQTVRGVEVLLEPENQLGVIGENVIFTITVKNTGNVWDNYNLTPSDDAGWTIKLDNDYLGIPKNENRETTLVVTIPDNENLVCTTNNITVVVTAVDNMEVTGNDNAAVHAVHAVPWAGTAVFSLVNLYTVNIEKILDIENGSKLVVKFYSYDNTFENENVIETFTTPPTWHVEENENARHPEGIGVKKARLDLTTDNTENVISTIASFVVRRDDLFSRIRAIKGRWPYASPDERDALFAEIRGIKGQWPYAPT
ncbi:MAG: hypothetical protein AVW06_03485 [Hadesarchaea archaeon DG-33-1]|nr:MAG: hypothetical protein AVW06_03485 [Hadesarchaea archaeon DG-33-1]